MACEQGPHQDLPQPSTITGILRRHGLLEPSTARPVGTPWKRFEREAPNELWQMDFKGWFPLARSGSCHPLTILDDHSRFNLLLDASAGENGTIVRPGLENVFRTYRLPDAILCDNGSLWGGSCGYFTSWSVSTAGGGGVLLEADQGDRSGRDER